jgi:hypothetical protein
MPVILATEEAEIRRIAVQSQPGQIVPRDSISKNPSQKKAGGVGQAVGPELPLSLCQNSSLCQIFVYCLLFVMLGIKLWALHM